MGNEFSQSGNKNIQRVFEQAVKETEETNKPCIVVLDELQKLIENHSNDKDPSSSQLDSLWSILDSLANKKIIFIGIFNPIKNELPKQIDTRFARLVIKMPLPDEKQRAEIIAFHIKQAQNKKIAFDHSVTSAITKLASITNSFCHRQLSEFIKEAIDYAKYRDKKNPVVTLPDCLKGIPAIKELYSKIHDKETWGQWSRKNWKFLTGTALTTAGLCLAYKSYSHHVAATTAATAATAAAAASQEKSNVFNRFMTLINYQLSWNGAQKTPQQNAPTLHQLFFDWNTTPKQPATAVGWSSIEVIRELMQLGFTKADLGLDKLPNGALSGIDQVLDISKKS